MTDRQKDAAAQGRPSARAIDRAKVERWTAMIASNDFDELHAAFVAERLKVPTVIWNPQMEDLTAEKLRFLLRYWNGLPRKGAGPRTSDIDPLDMRPALGNVMLVDAVEGGRDFRYRLYGSVLAEVSGFDMTGKLVSEHHASTYAIEFTLATYGAAILRPEPVFTTRMPARATYTAEWHRIVLPLVDDTGAVSRFLVGLVPVPRK